MEREVPQESKGHCWELSHGEINTRDRVQKQLPHVALSYNCLLFCFKTSESPGRLSIACSFTYAFSEKTLQAFGWQTAQHNIPYSFLDILLSGHPFKKERAILWVQITKAFL